MVCRIACGLPSRPLRMHPLRSTSGTTQTVPTSDQLPLFLSLCLSVFLENHGEGWRGGAVGFTCVFRGQTLFLVRDGDTQGTVLQACKNWQ